MIIAAGFVASSDVGEIALMKIQSLPLSPSDARTTTAATTTTTSTTTTTTAAATTTYHLQRALEEHGVSRGMK